MTASIIPVEEAKKKWCPRATTSVLTPLGGAAAGNRYADDTRNPAPQLCCITTDCMAWEKKTELTGYCRVFGVKPDPEN